MERNNNSLGTVSVGTVIGPRELSLFPSFRFHEVNMNT